MKKLLLFSLLFLLIGCTSQKNEIKDGKGEEKQIISEEFYSVVLENKPIAAEHTSSMILSIKLKNLNASPFITNIGADSCILVDNKGNKYKADFPAENQLEKALLPGEEILIESFDGPLMISFTQEGEVACNSKEQIGDWNSNMVKCIYDETGTCVCSDIGALLVDSCNFGITTDGRQAGNGWGKYPMTVKF